MKLKASIYPGLVLILGFLVIATLADQHKPLHQDSSKSTIQPELPKADYPKGPKGILTIHTDSNRNWFTLDKGLPITFVIKNTTNKEIEFGQINAEPVVNFVVWNSKHEKMPLTRYGNSIARHLTKDGMLIAGSQQSFKIKPGKEFKRRILLNQQFDMTEGGEYTISGSMVVGIGYAPMTLESNVIKIENDGFDAGLRPGDLGIKEYMYRHEQSQHHYDPNLMQP